MPRGFARVRRGHGEPACPSGRASRSRDGRLSAASPVLERPREAGLPELPAGQQKSKGTDDEKQSRFFSFARDGTTFVAHSILLTLLLPRAIVFSFGSVRRPKTLC